MCRLQTTYPLPTAALIIFNLILSNQHVGTNCGLGTHPLAIFEHFTPPWSQLHSQLHLVPRVLTLMGGVLGALICIYCKSGCSGTAVASALAFHPPIAYYDVVKDNNDGYSIIFSEEVQDSIASFQGFESLNTYVLTTKTNTKIPVIHISIPNAKYTILYR